MIGKHHRSGPVARCVDRRTRLLRACCALLLVSALLLPIRLQTAQSAGAQWEMLLSTTFSTGKAGAWLLGDFANGSAHLVQGRLVVGAASGQAFTELPRHPATVADGQISAVVRPGGDAQWQVGIAARVTRPRSGVRLYGCWIDNSAYIGCTRWSPTAPGGRYTTMFTLLGSPIKAGAAYTLSLRMEGPVLTFAVNGHVVETVGDPHPLPAGAWGLYVSSKGGPAQGAYARVDFSGRPLQAQGTPPAAAATATATGTGAPAVASVTTTAGAAPATAVPAGTPAFKDVVTVQPAHPGRGTSASISTTITATSGALRNGIVDVEVYTPDGLKVGQQYFSDQNLAAGQSATFPYTWPVPNKPGLYYVNVGVFGPNWAPDYLWDNSAATVSVP